MIYENCGICVLYGCILWLKSCSRFCMQMKFGKHQTGLGVNCNGKCQLIYSVGLQMWDDGKWIQTGIATAGRVPGSDCSSSDGWKCGGEPTLLMVARHNQPLSLIFIVAESHVPLVNVSRSNQICARRGTATPLWFKECRKGIRSACLEKRLASIINMNTLEKDTFIDNTKVPH